VHAEYEESLDFGLELFVDWGLKVGGMLRGVIGRVKSERDRLEFERKDDILSAVRESSKNCFARCLVLEVRLHQAKSESGN
jgi:hypothetical protein